MSTRIGHAFPRPGGAFARSGAPSRHARAAAAAILAIGVIVAGCDATVAPSPTPTQGVFANRPGVSIGDTWTSANGRWTFTGAVDPQGAATDVVLDIGPGPETLRQFDTHVPVAQQVMAAGPINVTTDRIPDIAQICVRFTASNRLGSSSTSPLCFPHDLPTAAPPGAPTVRIDQVAPAPNGQWTVTAYIDTKGAPTDATLDVGTGPAAAPRFSIHRSIATGMQLAGSLQVAFDLPAGASVVCVRVDVANSVGKASSDPSCFSPAASS